MTVFHTIFEQNLSASINLDGNVEFGFANTALTPAEALRSDAKAYEEEYRAWLNDVWLDTHRLRLQQLLKLRDNEKRFADMCSAASIGALVPMVGSGMSCASGLPSWREFLRKLRAFSSLEENVLELMLTEGKYEEAADRIANEMGSSLFDEQVEHKLRVESDISIDGPVRLLPEIFPTLVLTTNLDDVLEHVYATSGKKFQYLLAGKEIERYRKLQAGGSSCLLKLHGDCRKDDGRVLGVKEYNKAYGVKGGPRETLSLIFRTRPLLWLGCSLSIDRTVVLAGEIANMDHHSPRHFAVLQQPLDAAVCIARERELTARQIFPIWYDGDHDDCIETFLVGILDSLKRFEAIG